MTQKWLVNSSAVLASMLLVVTEPAALAVETDEAQTIGEVTFVQGESGQPELTDPEGETEGPLSPGESPGGQAGQGGPLSLDYAPNFFFGSDNKIEGRDVTLYAALQSFTDDQGGAVPVANFVQVSDLRGTFEGWHLTVTEESQLQAGDDKLTGAKLTIQTGIVKERSKPEMMAHSTIAGTTLVPGSASAVMHAGENQGMGTNVILFGSVKEGTAEEAISLEVLEGTQKVGVPYQTKLLWQLESGPGNQEQ